MGNYKINTIFYFCPTQEQYETEYTQQNVSPRTVVFVEDTKRIYKNGKCYDSGVEDQLPLIIQGAKDYSDQRLTSANAGMRDELKRHEEIANAKMETMKGDFVRNDDSRLRDYSIDVEKSDNGFVLKQPASNKAIYVDLQKSDVRINEALTKISNIENKLSTIDGGIQIDNTSINKKINTLSQNYESVRSLLSSANNTIYELRNRLDTLETQASITPTTHSLVIESPNVNLSNRGGKFSIPVVKYDGNTVSTITDSDISGLPSWVGSYSNGEYDYDENTYTTQRNATATVTYNGYTATFNIIQPAAEAQVTHSLTVGNNGAIALDSPNAYTQVEMPEIQYDGTSVTITSSNISGIPFWISVPSSNHLNIQENTSTESRTATLIITYNNITATLQISQPGAPEQSSISSGSLTISQSSIVVGPDSQTMMVPFKVYDSGVEIPTLNLTITTPTGVTYIDGWAEQYFSITENTTGGSRTFNITISYQGNSINFQIVQEAVQITKNITFTVVPTPSDATVEFYFGGQWLTQNSITVAETYTTFIPYRISKSGYQQYTSSWYPNGISGTVRISLQSTGILSAYGDDNATAFDSNLCWDITGKRTSWGGQTPHDVPDASDPDEKVVIVGPQLTQEQFNSITCSISFGSNWSAADRANVTHNMYLDNGTLKIWIKVGKYTEALQYYKSQVGKAGQASNQYLRSNNIQYVMSNDCSYPGRYVDVNLTCTDGSTATWSLRQSSDYGLSSNSSGNGFEVWEIHPDCNNGTFSKIQIFGNSGTNVTIDSIQNSDISISKSGTDSNTYLWFMLYGSNSDYPNVLCRRSLTTGGSTDGYSTFTNTELLLEQNF